MKIKNFSLAVGTVLVAVILLALEERGYAQGGRGGAGARGNQPPPTAKAAAPFDPTGNWVSVITNSWRTRMVPPPLGDYSSIPLNDAGRKVADAWDPAKDEAAKLECKYYGAASIMFQPTRLRVTWQDDQTLKMETDAGTQTRVLRFATVPATATGTATATTRPAAPRPRTWQGDSVAVWEARRASRGANDSPGRYLKVTTTNMLPGYLRKNGIPYGERASLTEYYDLFRDTDGTTMMIVTIAVDDPQYLDRQYIVVAHFKKESDASRWDPSPCSARW